MMIVIHGSKGIDTCGQRCGQYPYIYYTNIYGSVHICTLINKSAIREMNKIQEHFLNAVAKSKDKSTEKLIRESVVPTICSRVTWYKYLKNERQPSIQTANEILQVLKVWLPELTLDDLVATDEVGHYSSKTKLVK